MTKKSRFAIILVVLAVCFAFLWPTISWYYRTPAEDQALALRSLESIKDYSEAMAGADFNKLKDMLKNNPSEDISENAGLKWLADAAKANYKEQKADVPSPLTVQAALQSFDSQKAVVDHIESIYRNKILKDRKNYQNSVKLGLDLSGGMSVIVKADLDAVVASQLENGTDKTESQIKEEAMEQAIQTLTSRIDRFGLSSPIVRKQGEDRIYIEVPGSAESDQINSIIQGRGILNFRLVNNEATDSFNTYLAQNPGNTFDSQGRLINPSIIPEDCEVLGYYTTDSYGIDQRQGWLVVGKTPVLDGKEIKSAEIGSESITGRPQVNFTLTSEGAKIFGDFTGSHVGQNLCIVSDTKVKSNATIREAIPNGSVALSGFSAREAENIRKVLQTAWLEVPLNVESQQVVGADLGELAIRQGIMAIGIGLIAIMIFMLIWYKGAGINACVAQVLNLYIMFSILSALNLTVTLPMIAGMILTIGMAVDANVIIFERIKEERVIGKDRASSISAGFGNALWAILDSNITTFIAAAFMSQLGSGSIQGFAYSLAIGVVSTVFTALVVSRLMFDFSTETLHKKNISISWRIK